MLKYRQLSLRAGQTPVLDAIDLEVAGPGVFALLGPSGVGKSSLLRATQRLIEHGHGGWSRTGDVLFHGDSLFRPDLDQRQLARRIGFVQQRPRMLAGSVLDNVEFALRHTTRLSRRQIRRRAEAALEEVGLLDEVTRLELPAWQLSGGQAQRLAVARAMALDPEVLLLDEPVSSLDPLAAERVEQIIRRVAERRLVVLVTHKVGSAMRLATAAAFLLRGPQGARIHEAGAAPAVLQHPSDPVARELVRMSYGLPEPATVDASARAARTILFVCGGNTARSPLAADTCRTELLQRLGQTAQHLSEWGYRVDSAGLDVPDAPFQRLAAPGTHRPKPVTAELMAAADLVYAMTEGQCRLLVARFPASAGKVRRLDPVGDTADPHGRGEEAAGLIAARIRDAVRYRLAEWGPA